jgi:cation transport protein ChaC
MWVFGYGSLLWDGWEKQYSGKKYDRAVLQNFRRSFNKKSVRNWGTPNCPGATLGLEPDMGTECIGALFEFDERFREPVLVELRRREGKSFVLEEVEVVSSAGVRVRAVTAINDRSANTYIGSLPLEKRAAMARMAIGRDGACSDYVKNMRDQLEKLGVADPDVDQFYQCISGKDA